MEKPTLPYDDFAKLDLRIGTILECVEVEESQKLLKFLIDLGELGKRTILAGVKGQIDPGKVVGLQVLVLANLQAKKMMSFVSEGMILMGVEDDNGEEKISLLVSQEKVPAGTRVE